KYKQKVREVQAESPRSTSRKSAKYKQKVREVQAESPPPTHVQAFLFCACVCVCAVYTGSILVGIGWLYDEEKIET
ncbi:hypothetical protein, partial [Aeromonas veronii]|uniref:hypothetical protein n=1 Tax=Aeromonas veronii TaxID=654 RepID=UPI001C5AD2AB